MRKGLFYPEKISNHRFSASHSKHHAGGKGFAVAFEFREPGKEGSKGSRKQADLDRTANHNPLNPSHS
jgi:hypothetical protein